MRAKAQDSDGRRISEGLAFSWSVEAPLALEVGDEEVAIVRAGAQEGTAKVTVTATQGDRQALGEASVRVLSELKLSRPDAGIPQPEEINEPLQTWRSRLVDERWQINVGHPDYRALATEARPRLRYLANLLAKEIITRNFPRPEIGGILEEMVGVLSALERAGAWSRAGPRSSSD